MAPILQTQTVYSDGPFYGLLPMTARNIPPPSSQVQTVSQAPKSLMACPQLRSAGKLSMPFPTSRQRAPIHELNPSQLISYLFMPEERATLYKEGVEADYILLYELYATAGSGVARLCGPILRIWIKRIVSSDEC